MTTSRCYDKHVSPEMSFREDDPQISNEKYSTTLIKYSNLILSLATQHEENIKVP